LTSTCSPDHQFARRPATYPSIGLLAGQSSYAADDRALTDLGVGGGREPVLSFCAQRMGPGAKIPDSGMIT
jgi:hypothetical protein